MPPKVHACAWHKLTACDSERKLIVGPVVPENELWVLTSIHAKNNSGPTPEINVAVYDGHEWICLASLSDAWQYDGVDWSGSLVMAPGWGLGTWFRDAELGDVLQSDATYHVSYELLG